MQEDILIRNFSAGDRQAVREIAWETAFIGESGDIFFSGREILADFLTLYFTDYEPQSCFVAEYSGRVVGYLIGSDNVFKLEEVFRKKIFLRLAAGFVCSGGMFKRKNILAVLNFLASFLKGEFSMREVRKEYPATLHINLRKAFRGRGAGAKLIAVYEDYLRRRNIPGVYLATMSEASGKFFLKQGFYLLAEYPRSYFYYILKRNIKVYIYAKKLQ